MEIYSDNNLDLKTKKFAILLLFFCFLPFKIAHIIGSEYYIPKIYCWAMLLLTGSVPVCVFTKFGVDLIKRKLEFGLILLLGIIFNISVAIIEPVIIRSKYIFDINFYMFSSLIFMNFLGVLSGVFLVIKIISIIKNILSSEVMKLKLEGQISLVCLVSTECLFSENH